MKPKHKRPAITLRRLITWLGKKPAKETYSYGDIGNCLVCQFLKAQGFANPVAGGYAVSVGGDTYKLPDAIADLAEKRPHTFGSALKRAVRAHG